MKIWISFDMEGVAGIVDWDQCRPSGGARYEVGCQLMLAVFVRQTYFVRY